MKDTLTVILFWVRVPVLSLQITAVHPSVSIASRCFTIQSLLAILLAVSVRLTVIVAINPSGTLATMMPSRNVIDWIQVYPIVVDKVKNNIPRNIAQHDINFINRWSSRESGVCLGANLEVSLAILPITVWSPRATITPFPLPVARHYNETFKRKKKKKTTGLICFSRVYTFRYLPLCLLWRKPYS